MKTSSTFSRGAATLFLCVGASLAVMACGDDPVASTGRIPAGGAFANALVLDPAHASLPIGGSLAIRVFLSESGAALDPLATEQIVWLTDSPSVAMVGGSGLVTALEPGTAVISAAFEGRVGYAFVTVFDSLDTRARVAR